MVYSRHAALLMLRNDTPTFMALNLVAPGERPSLAAATRAEILRFARRHM
jgi:hypothetical protein